mmetsp:Transcript_22259/g.19774  ORF Transcript_22259/g.19774 Transcript_22259/m.19774 type:complete len:337 (-) Transcript_22259:40-1050(-)
MKFILSISFGVLTEILFGYDWEQHAQNKYPFETENGEIEDLDLMEFMNMLVFSYSKRYFNPVATFFPFVSKYNLINPFKRNIRNNKLFKEIIKNLVAGSKDTTSVAHKLRNCEELTEDEKVDDLILLIMAGHDTVSHSIVSCLYFVSKSPEFYAKLRKKLGSHGLGNIATFKDNLKLDSIQNLDYLSCCIKESSRFDTVASGSTEYLFYEDVTICGINIPKGTITKIDLITSHFDESNWFEPLSFRPERHDPESDFYKMSKTAGVTSDVYSRRTFSHGLRSCPGMSFATLEMKVIIAYLVSFYDIQFSEQDLQNEGIGFGFGSHFEPKVKISKVRN